MNLERTKKNRLLGTVGIFLLATSGYCDETSKPKATSLGLEVATSSSLHEFDSPNHTGDISISAAPAVKLPHLIKLSAQVGATKSLEGDLENSIQNPKISASRPFTLNPYLQIIPSASGSIALNESSVKRDSLQGAATLGSTVVINLERISTLKNLGAALGMAGTRNFHEFTTSRTGTSNTMLSLSTSLTISYSLTDQINLTASGARVVGLTYRDTPKNAYALTQSLSYAALENLEISLGHTTAGAAYKENGLDSAIVVFDGEQSIAYGSIGIIL